MKLTTNYANTCCSIRVDSTVERYMQPGGKTLIMYKAKNKNGYISTVKSDKQESCESIFIHRIKNSKGNVLI